MFSPLEQFDFLFFLGKAIFFLKISTLLVPFIFIFIYLGVFYNTQSFISKIYPKFMEFIFRFIFEIIERQAGYRGFKYINLVFFLFFFILFCNFLSLTPLLWL